MLRDFITKENTFEFIDDIYIHIKKENVHKNVFEYDKIDGTRLFERCRIPGTHSFFDYHLTINFLQTLGNLKGKIVLDLGCGDGRFTHWFLKNTQANIVCVDSCINSLKRLKTNIDYQAYCDRILLIQADILSLPKFKILFDMIWSFETLYYLNDKFEYGIGKISKLIKIGGTLINTERNYYGGLIHSLINGGIDDFNMTIESKKVFDYWGDSKPKSLLLQDYQMSLIMKKNNLSIIKKNRLPVFTMLISHLVSCNTIKFETIQKESYRIIQMFNKLKIPESMSRATIYCSKKINE